MDDKPTSKPLWQWVLMYPTLIVSLFGALPTFRDAAEAFYRDTTVSELNDGRRQGQLWSRNIECLSQPGFAHRTTPEKFEIGAAVCPTGDVLVHIRSPQAKEFYRWIAFSTVSSDAGGLATLLLGEAHAASLPPLVLAQSDQRVICQRNTGGGQIVRRIQSGAACVDEFIDTATGRLLRRVPARCDASC